MVASENWETECDKIAIFKEGEIQKVSDYFKAEYASNTYTYTLKKRYETPEINVVLVNQYL